MWDQCSGTTAIAVYWIAFVLGVISGALGMFACVTRRDLRRRAGP